MPLSDVVLEMMTNISELQRLIKNPEIFCINCKYHYTTVGGMATKEPFCAHPDIVNISPVDGLPRDVACIQARAITGICGPKAIKFEQKEIP